MTADKPASPRVRRRAALMGGRACAEGRWMAAGAALMGAAFAAAAVIGAAGGTPLAIAPHRWWIIGLAGAGFCATCFGWFRFWGSAR